MATPSAVYPFSPATSQNGFAQDDSQATPVQQQADERRRSKRESTQAATRRREEAATRYPSPPPGATSSAQRPRSIDPSLVIPPFNPNNRRQSTTTTTASTVSSGSSAAQRDQQWTAQDRLAAFAVPASNASPQVHHQQSHRPVSVAVGHVATPLSQHGPPPTSANNATSSRVRQSVGYLPSQAAVSSAGPYPQFYTPHPIPRQKIYFGPYILLQTLGEGEFGKVKLGLHSERWGEDVAIKLIKRGNVDTAQRGEKVRREIEVLKAVRHPNIVRLYDVIETEKYIGIVLEYASGGELFDHILAHRYLKERDASRMFAQLISGVAYLHAKGIVHRDLKLENLLLDRNRNCIITDFGFANRFHDPSVDLMATSCGSPCYAAPELVVQEGKYVGTAVDVWSCGVILYAMLAGYLPYDDDPNNPEGDNINLLYKYIINTPLTFPDWITAEPRDLLLQMLVPDPVQRCTIHDVMSHSWLRRFRPAFEKSVDELERQAQEMEMFKRQALEAQKQFLIAEHARQQRERAPGAPPVGMSRSQTTMGPVSGIVAMPSQRQRKDAIVSSASASANLAMEAQPSLLPASVPEETRSHSPQPIQTSQERSKRSSGFVPASPSTTQTHRISVDADPFSFETRQSPVPSPAPSSVPMKPSLSAPPDAPAVSQSESGSIFGTAPSTPVLDSPAVGTRSRRSSGKPVAPVAAELTPALDVLAAEEAERERRKRAHRATLQVEYDGAGQRTPSAMETSAPPSRSASTKFDDVVMSSVENEDVSLGSADVGADVSLEDATPTASAPAVLPPRPATPPLVPLPSTPVSQSPLPAPAADHSTPKKRKSDGSPRSDRTAAVAPASENARPAQPDVDSTPKAKKSSDASSGPRPPSVASSSVSRHRHGVSTDRFSLRSLLSGSTTSLDKKADAKRDNVGEKAELAALEEVTNKRKSRRQKAMSLQPFKSSGGGGGGGGGGGNKSKTSRSEFPPPAPSSRAKSRVSVIEAEGSMAPPPPRQSGQRPTTRSSVGPGLPSTGRANSADLEANWASAQPAPSGKAKAVMDWFRRRSTRAYPGGDAGSSLAPSPIATDFDRRPMSPASTVATVPASSNASMADGTTTPVTQTPVLERTPSVVVTSAALPAVSESHPPSRSASGAQSQLSHFSHKTTSTTATSVSSISSVAAANAAAVAGGGSVSSHRSLTPSTGTVHAPKLRTHLGALDKNALTYRNPTLVMMEIRSALWNMGVDTVQEGEFKIKCVRKSKKKALAATNASGSIGSNSSVQGHTTAVERRNSLAPSPSVSSNLIPTSTSFRSLFTRKGSAGLVTSPSMGGGPMSPTLSESAFENSPVPPSVSQFGQFSPPGSPQPQPVYGDHSTDHGDEVKFMVELCSVKHLESLVIVDVKRTKGNAWSFKTVYSQLIGSLDLGDV